jgi:hypothetical protein
LVSEGGLRQMAQAALDMAYVLSVQVNAPAVFGLARELSWRDPAPHEPGVLLSWLARAAACLEPVFARGESAGACVCALSHHLAGVVCSAAEHSTIGCVGKDVPPRIAALPPPAPAPPRDHRYGLSALHVLTRSLSLLHVLALPLSALHVLMWGTHWFDSTHIPDLCQRQCAVMKAAWTQRSRS